MTEQFIVDEGESRDITVKGKVTLLSVLTKPCDVKRIVRLQGKGSSYRECTILVGNHQFNVITDVTTDAPESKVDVDVKGVLTGTGSAKVIGNLHILKGAVKSESRVSQHMLLVGDSRAECIPNLEIDENDVKAGHAATVRPLNPDHLFYLTSRGLSPQEARILLIQSFLAVMELPSEMQAAVNNQLGELHVLLA